MSRWNYTPEKCDGRPCVGDCDKCNYTDVAEVKHGKWQEEYKEDAPIFFKRRWVCSVCGDYQTYGATEYCPMCGADMRERKTSKVKKCFGISKDVAEMLLEDTERKETE